MAGVLVGAHVKSAGGIFNAVTNGEAIEAEAIQVFPSPPQTWRQTKHTPEAIAKFRELREASGIREVWIHNIYLANLAAEDPAQLEKSIDSVVYALGLADQIGAVGVVLHTGSHRGAGLEACAPKVCAALETILERAPGDAVLALENAAGHGGVIGRDFAELGQLMRSVGSRRLRACLDTCHAYAAGYDIATKDGLDAAMAAFDEAIGLELLAVVHANDSKEALGGLRDRHENIGDGHIGVEGFRHLMEHPAFAGTAFLLEVPGLPAGDGEKKERGPDLENVRRLKRIRDEAEAGARPSRRRPSRSR